MAKKQEELTFEVAMEKLEAIVQKLEEGTAALDDSIALYKEGLELSKWCHTKLNQAEEQIAVVIREDGEEAFSLEGEG